MIKILTIIVLGVILVHGLIHLMGFVAYWPLAKLDDLPYKTSLLKGRWDVGAAGMRVYSILWLLAVLGFVASFMAIILHRSWWPWLMLPTVLLSLVVCILDWQVAFRGAWIDVFLLVGLFFVFGLRVKPAPFTEFSAPTAAVRTVPVPSGLPAPVERFYHLTYGDEVPVYTSAVISGRGTVRLLGITLPARMRFSHVSGKDYRHYFEATFYGIPVLKVNEDYVDGHNRLQLPFKVFENDEGSDGAANQGLWAESMAYPAIFATDPRVRWQAIDDNHARLLVPYANGVQEFTVTFDPQSGELTRFETVRYRDAKSGLLPWWCDRKVVLSPDGLPEQEVYSAVWSDEGTPWLTYQLEQAVFNADLSSYIRQMGQ